MQISEFLKVLTTKIKVDVSPKIVQHNFLELLQ
jgi:hypothetical protein